MINELVSKKRITIGVSVILFIVLMITAISMGRGYYELKKESDANYQKGIEAFSASQWSDSIDYLSKVGTTSGKNHDDAVSKIQTALNNSKAELAAQAQAKADADARAKADAEADARAKVETSSYSSNPSSSTNSLTYTPSSNSVGSSANTFRSSALNVLGSIDSFHDKVLADYYQYIRARDSGNIQQANQKFSILMNDGNDIASMLNALNSVKKTQTSQRDRLVTQALQDYVYNIANIFSVLGFYTGGKLSDAQVWNEVSKNEKNINDIKAIINANL